jgi:hypothetical protein
MVMIKNIPGDDFQPPVGAVHEILSDVHLAATFAADQMVMINVGEFIRRMSIVQVGVPNDAHSDQELERPIHGGLREPGCGSPRPGINGHRGNVPSGVAQDVQDGLSLGREAESA